MYNTQYSFVNDGWVPQINRGRVFPCHFQFVFLSLVRQWQVLSMNVVVWHDHFIRRHWYRVLSLWVECSGYAVDCLPPSGGEVTNEWSSISATPVYLHVVNSDIWTFIFLIIDTFVSFFICRKQIPPHSFLLPTDTQENCFKRSIKIYINMAPTCFGVITIIRERTTLVKFTVLKQLIKHHCC